MKKQLAIAAGVLMTLGTAVSANDRQCMSLLPYLAEAMLFSVFRPAVFWGRMKAPARSGKLGCEPANSIRETP